MAVVVTNTWVRPNTEVDFYEPSESEKNYITINFIDNDKYSVISSLYSDDDLTKIRVVSFEDAATRNFIVREIHIVLIILFHIQFQ